MGTAAARTLDATRLVTFDKGTATDDDDDDDDDDADDAEDRLERSVHGTREEGPFDRCLECGGVARR